MVLVDGDAAGKGRKRGVGGQGAGQNGLVERRESAARGKFLIFFHVDIRADLRKQVDSKAKRPTTAWTKERACFTLCIPKVRLPSTSIIVAGLSEDLLGAFAPPRTTLALHGTAAGASDDWADVQVDTKTGHAQAVDAPTKRGAAAAPAEPTFLPPVDALARPEDLLSQPPYHALVQWRGSELEVHCSHAGALQLLRDYLDRWARQNFRDVRHPPSIEVVLEESPIGLGLLFNRLVIRPQSRNMAASQTLSPVVILPFIEGVLGFTMVSSEAGLWHYRREGELRKL